MHLVCQFRTNTWWVDLNVNSVGWWLGGPAPPGRGGRVLQIAVGKE